mmetsp:Transcript_29704/g.42144  ORF Transcript_29704/g.42144 Transcript_29704/m.42144 type:complete len:91 (+) Transcript_29704:281-553(+)
MGCPDEAAGLVMVIDMPHDDPHKIQHRHFSLQKECLRKKEPGQEFRFGIEEFEHINVESLMVTAPYVDKEGGKVVAEQGGVELEGRVGRE